MTETNQSISGNTLPDESRRSNWQDGTPASPVVRVVRKSKLPSGNHYDNTYNSQLSDENASKLSPCPGDFNNRRKTIC